MIIAIDIGNTTITFGFFRNDEMILRFSLPSSSRITAERCWKKFQAFYILETKIKGAIFSSVSPDMTKVIEKFINKYLKTKGKQLDADSEIGIISRYQKKQELGADRIANALGAKMIYSLPAIIIDFGTAITIDVVGKKSDFLGGLILPGIGISAEALHKKTSLLPKVELIIPPHILGKNTITAMQAGLTYGFSGMVKFLVEKIIEETAIESPEVILTGGHARILETLFLNFATRVDPDLTLKGLNCAYSMI